MKWMAKPVIIIAAALMTLLNGCTYMLSNPEELIEPPKLDYEQSKIYEALEQSVGKDITLKYPKTGEYRSAFIRYDIDGDDFKEAIVFYHSNNIQTGQPLTHIKLLDFSKDKWEAVCDIGGEAIDIDRLTFANFDGRVRMVVGWELISNKEKTLMVYKLENRLLSREYSDTYVEFVAKDFNSDGFDELITINNRVDKALQNNVTPQQSARLFSVRNGKIQVISTTQLDATVMGYYSCSVGKVSNNQWGVFLDGIKGANILNTQIIMADQENRLSNPLLTGQQLSLTERRSMIPSKDIDGDGIYDIPNIQVMPGYEKMPDEDKMWITSWQRLESDKLVIKRNTITNTTYGFVFTIPSKWMNKVTVKRAAEKDEFIFVEYKGTLDNSVDELFRLRITAKNKYLGEPEGYFKITENSVYVYSAVIAQRVSEYHDNPLRLDQNDIMYYLTVT